VQRSIRPPHRYRRETGRNPGATSPEPKNEKLAEHKRHLLYPEPTAPPPKKPRNFHLTKPFVRYSLAFTYR
jgi:hypothetical protein